MLVLLLACQNDQIVQEKQLEDTFVESDDIDENDTGENKEICQELSWSEEKEFIPQSEIIVAERDFCTQNWHASAGAKGSTLSIELTEWGGIDSAQLRIVNLREEPIVDWIELETGGSFLYELEQSGEFFIQIAANDQQEERNSYQLTVECREACELEYTRYPIVFLHGLAGFDSLLNVMDYWVGVEEQLSGNGYSLHIDGVPAFDTTYVRTEIWQAILADLVEQGVGRRFNLIGHSQGGLDSRYLASNLDPDHRIVSITTIATPHYGSPVADVLSGALEGLPFDGTLVNALFDIGSQVFGTSGEDLSGQLAQMSPENMLIFNQENPNREDVRYFSWSGKSCRVLQFSCRSDMEDETISSYFHLAHLYIETEEGDNDGLVSTSSAQWGEYLGELPADHMDEVGHRFDLSHQPFQAAEFYLSEARRLASEGF